MFSAVLFEILLTVIVIFIGATQVIMPMFGMYNGRFFWLFRKPERRIAQVEKMSQKKEAERDLAEAVSEYREKFGKKKKSEGEGMDT